MQKDEPGPGGTRGSQVILRSAPAACCAGLPTVPTSIRCSRSTPPFSTP